MPINMGLIIVLSIIYVDPLPAPKSHPDPKRYMFNQKAYYYMAGFQLLCLQGYATYVGILLVY
jgi:hypothetical protein